ncbi:MAG: exonuclease SbcCD subunit D [Eubacterium sp.]|nr:exonuclease SbcCD subunit D [Eubacterium sp.]
MKFIHLSDLHIGKRVYEYSLLEDQAYILEEILKITEEERPDAAFLAGDIYDKSVPSAEAVALFDDFLVKLKALVPEIFIVSGNHDSAARVAFGGRIMDRSGIHISPVYDGRIEPVSLETGEESVNIYLLPYIKPVQVKHYFPEEEINSFSDALKLVIRQMNVDTDSRNILVAHLCVTGAERAESEELYIGGAEDVPAELFEPFDYTALGHIHRPQNISRTVRYCGTPLKYSFSEAKDRKSVTVGELHEDGVVSIKTVPLIPKRDMVEIRGTYEEVTARDFYADTSLTEDYVHVILTDEEDIPDAAAKLSVIYHGFMKLDYDNKRTRQGDFDFAQQTDLSEKTPFDLFADLYEKQNSGPMDKEQAEMISSMIEKCKEAEK